LVHIKYKAGRRFVLNDFLLDILYRPEFKESFGIFPEIRMEASKIVGNKKRKIIGDTDYTIGLERIRYFQQSASKRASFDCYRSKD
jgi:hypothetical protein